MSQHLNPVRIGYRDLQKCFKTEIQSTLDNDLNMVPHSQDFIFMFGPNKLEH